MKKITIAMLFFYLSVFSEKMTDLPRYQPETSVDEDVVLFLNDQNSFQQRIVNRIAQSKIARDILGRLSKDTTIYVLRDDLYEKKIPVGIIDLKVRNKSEKYTITFQRMQNGNKNVLLNGKKISLEEYRKISQIKSTHERERNPYIRYDYLNAQEINNLISGPSPVRIFHAKKKSIKYDYVNVDYALVFGYSGVNNLHSAGQKGSGVGLFFEEGCPYVDELDTNFFIQSGSCSNPDMHATKVAKILQLTAPEAMVVNFDGSDAVISIVQNNANRFNPKLEIGSYSWHYVDPPCINGLYCDDDQLLDEHIYEDRLIYFVAAGNIEYPSDIYVGSPGKALNAITVGAVNPYTRAYISESKWKNSEILNQKPEIANFTDIYLGSLGSISGTSASTPYSAAIAANVLSADSDLKRHPEVIKAMFLMNATEPIVNGNTYDDDDWFSVSSNLPYFKINNGLRYRWWSGSNLNVFDNNEKIIFYESGISSGQHCRAAISWLTSGSYAGQYKFLAQDIDLYVYQGTTEPISSSLSAYNPFEVVDFTTQSSADLKFEIKRFANSQSDDVVLGFTMRCDYE